MVIVMIKVYTKVRDFVVGIDYESNEEDKGHMTLRRKVSIEELVEEIKDILQHGSSYPQFPPEANPSITYAWDLSNEDDGDIYHELINELDKQKHKGDPNANQIHNNSY